MCDEIMANLSVQTEQPPPAQTPLLHSSNQTQNHIREAPPPQPQPQQQNEETLLDQTLARLETFLSVLGFQQSSALSLTLSWSAFIAIGMVLPIVALALSECSDCERYQLKSFEMGIVAFQASLAAVSLLCLSHNLRKYGLRRFLFVDRYTGHIVCFHKAYVQQIKVSTIVQVVGIIICLHAATRISHRAQGIVSLASRWHALVTCTSSDASQLRNSASVGNLEAANQLHSLYLDYSESDIESLDYVGLPTNTQLASYMASHHKRQAFVMYLQTNPGGITIFGWTVDRSLVNTIFFLELSLVTFVLSKTIV